MVIPADGIISLEGTDVSKVLVDCVAQDDTAILGTPLPFYLWSTTVELQLSRMTLRSVGGFNCSLPSYQTARIDVPANFTNPATTPSQIQANIYSLVKDKVCVYNIYIVHTYIAACTVYTQHMYVCAL